MENDDFNIKGYTCSVIALISGIAELILTLAKYDGLMVRYILLGLAVCCGSAGIKNGNKTIARIGLLFCLIATIIRYYY